MTFTGIGIAIGLAGAMVASQAIAAMLFRVLRLDPMTYVIVIVLLAPCFCPLGFRPMIFAGASSLRPCSFRASVRATKLPPRISPRHSSAAITEMFAPCIAIQYPTKPRAAPATAGGFPHPKSPNPRFIASHCSLPLASLRA